MFPRTTWLEQLQGCHMRWTTELCIDGKCGRCGAAQKKANGAEVGEEQDMCVAGDTVELHYAAYVWDGCNTKITLYETTRNGPPMRITLGQQEHVCGLDEVRRGQRAAWGPRNGRAHVHTQKAHYPRTLADGRSASIDTPVGRLSTPCGTASACSWSSHPLKRMARRADLAPCPRTRTSCSSCMSFAKATANRYRRAPPAIGCSRVSLIGPVMLDPWLLV